MLWMEKNLLGFLLGFLWNIGTPIGFYRDFFHQPTGPGFCNHAQYFRQRPERRNNLPGSLMLLWQLRWEIVMVYPTFDVIFTFSEFQICTYPTTVTLHNLYQYLCRYHCSNLFIMTVIVTVTVNSSNYQCYHIISVGYVGDCSLARSMCAPKISVRIKRTLSLWRMLWLGSVPGTPAGRGCGAQVWDCSSCGLGHVWCFLLSAAIRSMHSAHWIRVVKSIRFRRKMYHIETDFI